MKQSTYCTARMARLFVGGMAAISSLEGLALGYDSLGDAPAGTAATERHFIHMITEASDCPDLAVCANSVAIGAEFRVLVNVTNTTTCTAFPGTCTPANVPDNYQGVSGSATVGTAPDSFNTEIHAPACPLGSAPCYRDVQPTTNFWDWDFNTDARGKLTDGYMVFDSSTATWGRVTVLLIEQGIARSYRGVASDLNVTCAVDVNADFTTCWNGIFPNSGPLAEEHFDYVTVPSNFPIEKSVPMPLFAAAALGVSLALATAWTGSRRSVGGRDT